MKKRSFLNNIGLFLSTREKILNDIRSKIFLTKNTRPEQAPEKAPEPAPESAPEPSSEPELNPKVFDMPKTKIKRSPLKLREKLLNEIKMNNHNPSLVIRNHRL